MYWYCTISKKNVERRNLQEFWTQIRTELHLYFTLYRTVLLKNSFSKRKKRCIQNDRRQQKNCNLQTICKIHAKKDKTAELGFIYVKY